MTAKTCLLSALCAVSLFGQTGRGSGKMEGSVHRAKATAGQDISIGVRAIRTMPRPARRVALRALAPDEWRPVTRKPGLTPVGISREVPPGALTRGEWSNAPNGMRVWRLELSSPDADALRVRLEDFHVGTGQVWLLGAEATIGPYSGDGPFGDGEFWTDLVAGDSVVIAYEPEPNALAETLPFKLSQVSHRFRAAAAKSTSPAADETEPRTAAAASCAVEVTCHPDYSEPASAVALMVFESGGESYQCSGSLVSSASQPPVPFFLTANHCISTEEEARSLITFFNYQTTSCGGAVPRLSSLPRVTGATYITGEAMALGDFTLLRLTSFPNIDVKVLGWSADPISSDERVTSISHPRGDHKRIAFGQRTRDVTIRFSGGERMPASKGYQVTWFDGVTQSGSSGSPMLVTIGGKQYVVGTLSAGPDVDEDNSTLVCRTRNLVASYGRFSEAFPYLGPFLGSATPPATSRETRAMLVATPSPIVPAAGQTTGRTTLSWQAPGYDRVQIRVGAPDGPAMTGIEASSGLAQTGDWVSNGMTFYLQDASDGDSAGASKTIATVRVYVFRYY